MTTDRFNKANSAYYFNGNSWIETTQYRLLDGAINATISVWAMINSGTNGQILSCGDYRGGLDPISLHFMNQNADAMWFQNTLLGNVQNSQIGISNAPNSLPHFTAGIWHNVVLVLSTNTSQGSLTCYIDGMTDYVQKRSNDGVNAFTKIAYDRDMRFLIGALEGRPFYSTPSQFWSGKLDDIRIYNRSLTSTEVAQLYAIESGQSLTLIKAVTLQDASLNVGSNYQVQVSSDLINWTNQGSVFTAASSYWRSTNYWDVENWNQLFFRLLPQ